MHFLKVYSKSAINRYLNITLVFHTINIPGYTVCATVLGEVIAVNKAQAAFTVLVIGPILATNCVLAVVEAALGVLLCGDINIEASL